MDDDDVDDNDNDGCWNGSQNIKRIKKKKNGAKVNIIFGCDILQ